MFKLSPKQIDYLNKERDILIERIELKRKHKIPDGTIPDSGRMEAIKLIIELHNLELKKKDD